MTAPSRRKAILNFGDITMPDGESYKVGAVATTPGEAIDQPNTALKEGAAKVVMRAGDV